MHQSPLADLTVVEVGGSVAGAYCAKLFADLGAQVLRVGSHALTAAQHAYYDERKHPVAADAIEWASIDVVIESTATGPPTRATPDLAHLVRVEISPFGSTGPYASWRSSDLVDYAISGHAALYGHPEREPLRGPADQPAVAAGLFGFIGAMAALFARTAEPDGRGQLVEVNHHQVMVALHQMTLIRYQLGGDVMVRMGNRYTGQGQPNGPYRCSDGWISIAAVTDQQVEGILAVTGLMHLLDAADIESPMDFQIHTERFDAPLREWLANQSVDETVELFQAMRVPACPVLHPADLLGDDQLTARDFFRPLADRPDRLVPRLPFTMSHLQSSGGRGWKPVVGGAGPLAGLRVLDLARVWAGPLCTRILSDLGADVVWVEAPWSRGPRVLPQSLVDAARYYAPPPTDPTDPATPDRPWNRSGHFVKYSLGKRSLALDLATEQGRQAFARLVPEFHVLVENFSPRVMPQFGFDEDRLHELNPDLIYVTMPGYGRTGPAVNWLAYGSCIDSHAGLSHLNGYPGEAPWKGGIAWPDPIAGLHACTAILGSLWGCAASDRPGGGLTIEAAQFESTIAAIGDRVVEAQQGRLDRPAGNHDPAMRAQGVYRCLGNDRWIAVTIADDAAASRLAAAISGAPNAGAPDARLAPPVDDAELRTMLAPIAARSDAVELAAALQAGGIAAAPVTTAPDVIADPHLSARDAWVTVEQPDIGPFTAPPAPIGLSRTPVAVRAPAPTLGQHNVDVLLAAGFRSDEIASLNATGVIVTAPPS